MSCDDATDDGVVEIVPVKQRKGRLGDWQHTGQGSGEFLATRITATCSRKSCGDSRDISVM